MKSKGMKSINVESSALYKHKGAVTNNGTVPKLTAKGDMGKPWDKPEHLSDMAKKAGSKVNIKGKPCKP
jgi:hypothetical protein